MELTKEDHEIVAKKLVADSLTAPVERNKISSEEYGTFESGKLSRRLNEIIEEEIIEEDISGTKDDSEILHDSLEDDPKSVSRYSEKSSKYSKSSSSCSTSTTSSSSSSSKSSFKQTKQKRFDQTFKKNDLIHELNKTRVVNRGNGSKSESPTSKRKVNSWVDPTTIRGTEHEKKKMEEWISRKDAEKKEKLLEARRAREEKKQREIEKTRLTQQLQEKNFALWESQKKTILEQKLRKSEELKARKKDKALENIEKAKYSEKAFQQWKSRKEEKIKDEKKQQKQKHQEEAEEQRTIQAMKEREQTKGFEKWCQRQQELDTKQKEVEKTKKEAEAELELLQEYRRQDADDEYLQWKQDKLRHKSVSPRPVEHPLGWAPAGKSDGKHRLSPNVRPATPGEPLSKTLAHIKNGGNHHRRLKTVDVCCRQISFWCHCPPDGQSRPHSPNGEDTYQRSFSQPERTSTPKHNFLAARNFDKHPYYGMHEFESTDQLSRHTSPANSRPSTPVRHRS